MDFLTLAIIYTVVFVAFSYVLLVGGSSFHDGGLISWIRSKLFQVNDCFMSVCQAILPQIVLNFIDQIVDYLFFKRNYCMVLFYTFLITSGSAIYTVKIVPFFEKANVFCVITYLLITADVIFFVICCRSDPGIISSHTLDKYINDYHYDGLYYTKSKCHTCGTDKPSRSKHCSICNMCVSRFDHHCSWVNNCIGKHNYKYFLAFIFTTCLLSIYTTVIILVVFTYIVISEGLMSMKYVGNDGGTYPVTIRHICQHLLIDQPIIFTLLVTALMVSFLLSIFSCVHIYLLFTNQTTNELYKRFRSSKPMSQVSRDNRKTISAKEIRMKLKEKHNPPSKTPFYIDIWSNIMDVLKS
ncbi:probable palmitoyltransferase ZDHHC4 [Actinia tenebrosa]|uniref:Palmitoyltransferase n=1 Tax=Actinia tenebrosa TaxID=6105 RepID=A0A6P8HY66_ACTTE|nr:probable palmitoyltransferase ZDHHC4 [Actinia tenebrosa]